jgi:hypothetical protein
MTLKEIKAKFDAPFVPANHDDFYRGISMMSKEDVELLIRAVEQLGASHNTNMKHSEHAGYAAKCGVCKAVVEIESDVLDLIAPNNSGSRK